MSGDEHAKNRGHRPSIGPSGEAEGSGAGAGMGGAPEEIDGDEQSGGRDPDLPVDKANPRPSHN